MASTSLHDEHHGRGRQRRPELSIAHADAARVNLESRTASSATGASAPRRAHPTVNVVIPTLNEAENLPDVLSRLPKWIDEVIIVDGHSTDETLSVAKACRPDVKIVLQDGKGKGNALACGFRAATGDITVMLDADGSTGPAEIPPLRGRSDQRT